MKLNILLTVMATALCLGCGGGGNNSSTSTGGGGGLGTGSGGTGSTGIPQVAHVIVLVEENHGYSDVVGSVSMPYLNSLAASAGLATQYYADAHPSLPNYFELTVGEGTSITQLAGDSYSGTVTQDNVVRALVAAGKTWKYYGESLPSVGYLGGDSAAYVRKHDPFVYLQDVSGSASQTANVVPFSEFATDLTNNALPSYSFIVPDLNNDAHDCPLGLSTCTDAQKLANADQWLRTNIDPLIKNSAFQNSLLIITFDEALVTDITNGGGRVATYIISPKAKQGFQSATVYDHASLLRLSMKALGISDFPGAAATATDMTEFFP